MVSADAEEEDRRRVCRERKVLIGERVEHINRIKGLLFSQGISSYEALRRDRRQRLEELKTATAVFYRRVQDPDQPRTRSARTPP